MSGTTTPNANAIARCPGRYEPALDAFGQIIHRQCIGCQRRTPGNPDQQEYMASPEFEARCPKKITESVDF